MEIGEYFDQLKQMMGLKEDKELADALLIARSSLSQYRGGKVPVPNSLCLRIAVLLDLRDPVDVLLAADETDAKRAGRKSMRDFRIEQAEKFAKQEGQFEQTRSIDIPVQWLDKKN